MNTPSVEVLHGSVRFPWPTVSETRGPAIRVVADDAVWQGAIRRCVERWRNEHTTPLGLLKFQSITELAGAVQGPQLLDIVLVTREGLSAMAEWISSRPRDAWTVVILCQSTFVESEDLAAAQRLLGEAGARVVIHTLRDLDRLETLLSHLPARGSQLDPLAELPLACWGPAWQLRP